MKNFKNISSIVVNEELSWKDKIFLTFDIDWAHDDVLNDTIDLVEEANIAATWFVTHETPLLSRLRANSKFELGLHPNFNFLLEGDIRNGKNCHEVIDRMYAIVPEAVSARSHSMTQNSGILELFKSRGLTHEVNHFIPAQTHIELKPWLLWNNLVRVPYNWEDDVHCMYGLEKRLSSFIRFSGLKVFDFHPIHIFLNTENLDRYERTRPLHQKPDELIKHRYEGYGTRNRLLELLMMAKND
ncbi:MAG: hypothetical protein IPP55_18545 [Anaerolineales bacterium]|jgi:hypothetical protein|nr:hypothetical protein [Anaerolineales bacterium]